MTTAPEPALKSYFFGKGYRDLRATIEESWQRNLASARAHFAAASLHMSADEKPMALIWGAAGVSVVVFGTVLFLVASTIHIAVLGLFFSIIYLGFSLVYLSERAYLAWKGFFAVCPECHSKRPLPEYFCSGCGEVHRRLVPSSYGILHHVCRCGQRLPATFFLQRGRLQSRCPDCEALLDRDHTETRKAFIPVVGGPAVGKSAFLFTAMRELFEHAAPSAGLTPSFVDSRTESDFRRIWQQSDSGTVPDKTVAALPRAYNLRLDRPDGAPRLLYVYDPAGEAFEGVEGLILHKYQDYLSGLILLIDPFSLAAVRDAYADRLQAAGSAIKPSGFPPEDVLDRLLINLEQNFELRKADRIPAGLAVVVSKVDAFDLADSLGEPAAESYLRRFPTIAGSDARHRVVREQLLRWDEAGLVAQCEARFAKVRYFACSALGRLPDESGRAFEPWGVLEPLLWLLGEVEPVLVKAVA